MDNSKKIAIGGDHAGFHYKTSVSEFLIKLGWHVKDFGTYSNDSVDYPDFAHPVSKSVEEGSYDFGILICGSANGVAMTANKHNGIRAAICWEKELASLSRQHNNANILCIPARFVSADLALDMVEIFINTPFEGGRHQTRVQKINC